MNEEKAKIFLDRILERIENGEFDEHLNIPFASRKLLRALVESKMAKKVETNSTPVLSDMDLWHFIDGVRETAAYTAFIFFKNGILIKDENGSLVVNPKLDKSLYSS